jgi:LysM repeat protein
VTQKKPLKDDQLGNSQPLSARDNWFVRISWGITLCLVVIMIAFVASRHMAARAASTDAPAATQVPTIKIPYVNTESAPATMPAFDPASVLDSISPLANFHTIAPTHPRESAQDYTVSAGDSIFGIAHDFNIKPESVLWANYNTLKDNPDMISIGLQLIIPPTDGVYYKWQDGDTLEGVAGRFKTTVDAILSYPGNKLDMTNPVIKPGDFVMLPGGSRPFQQWLVPTIARGKAGVAVTVIGPGACDTSTGGYFGSGSFIWPAASHLISGNDFAPWHLGIDIGAGMGSPVYAADSGLVVYAGWSYQGYGNMIMIDHGNGYQTLYGHLSTISIACGQGVIQGGLIGYSGSTGNSTGPHLHFEVRYMGGFINPHYVLP